MFQLQLFFLLHCDEWDRVVALPRHKFVTGATLLQLGTQILFFFGAPDSSMSGSNVCPALSETVAKI